MTHTPTPWVYDEVCRSVLSVLSDPNNEFYNYDPYSDTEIEFTFICDFHNHPNKENNAAFIVKAVNCHDELLKALEGLANAYSFLPEAVTGEGTWHNHAMVVISKAKGESC